MRIISEIIFIRDVNNNHINKNVFRMNIRYDRYKYLQLCLTNEADNHGKTLFVCRYYFQIYCYRSTI